jgi:hypothetical protein
MVTVINSYRANPGNKEVFLEIHSELIYLISTAKNRHEDRILER